MDIIIKKLREHFADVNPDSQLVMGDARQELGRGLLGRLEDVINTHGHLERYLMVVHANPRPDNRKIIKTTIIVLPATAEKFLHRMLGTMCFLVDNRSGRLERRWILPLNIYQPDETLGSELVANVAGDARGLPVL